MQFYFSDQQKNFSKYLSSLKSRRVTPYDLHFLADKKSTIEIKTSKKLTELDLGFFFNYQIFPPSIMSFLTEWNSEQRQIQIGDNIVQQVYIPPFEGFSQKIVFGVRVSNIINEPDKKGFSYETLDGHVEKGISTFTLEQIQDKVIFQIHTFSEPGNVFSKLLAPVFSLPYQNFCTNMALKNVKQQLEQQ